MQLSTYVRVGCETSDGGVVAPANNWFEQHLSFFLLLISVLFLTQTGQDHSVIECMVYTAQFHSISFLVSFVKGWLFKKSMDPDFINIQTSNRFP